MTLRSAAWMRFGAAVLAGVVAAFGQAPYDLPLVLLAALAAVLLIYRAAATPRQAAAIGWGFGFGYFLHGWSWLVSPFMVDPERYAWMAPFAVAGLTGGLALYWALAFYVSRRLSAQVWPLIFVLPAAEMLRGYLFTGFPWGMFSQSLVNHWPGQGLALVGPYGMTLAFVALAVAVVQRARGTLLRQGAIDGALLGGRPSGYRPYDPYGAAERGAERQMGPRQNPRIL